MIRESAPSRTDPGTFADLVAPQRAEEAAEADKRAQAEAERLKKKEEAKDRKWKKEQATSLAVTKKINSFLQQNGYGNDVNGQRKVLFKTHHPLHDAVNLGDADVVVGLLAFGADPSLRNSDGKTPLEIAQKKNKNGSLKSICEALEAAETRGQ